MRVSPSPSPSPTGPLTPNTFFARGTPTFIVDPASKDCAGQARFLRGLIFPDAQIIAPADKLPANPVFYGIPRGQSLPFTMTADSLTIGGQTLKGDDLQLLTSIPNPDRIVFAGTGSMGCAEINARTGNGVLG